LSNQRNQYNEHHYQSSARNQQNDNCQTLNYRNQYEEDYEDGECRDYYQEEYPKLNARSSKYDDYAQSSGRNQGHDKHQQANNRYQKNNQQNKNLVHVKTCPEPATNYFPSAATSVSQVQPVAFSFNNALRSSTTSGHAGTAGFTSNPQISASSFSFNRLHSEVKQIQTSSSSQSNSTPLFGGLAAPSTSTRLSVDNQVYSDKLGEMNLKLFQQPHFTYRQIPLQPPTKSLCF
jgi:hypothetical protein